MTVNLPAMLYERLLRRAQETRRTVELELVEAAVAGLSRPTDELPADLSNAIAPLALLDDAALFRAAQSRLSGEALSTLEELHLKRQDAGLTAAEVESLDLLTKQYERTLLIRAEAAALLKRRGHDVSGVLRST